MLHVDTLNIAAGIAASEAHELYKLLTVKLLLTLGNVNVQILSRVVVVHSGRNVEVNAADGVNDLLCRIHINENVSVNVKAEEGLDKLLSHLFDRVAAVI